VKTLNDFVSRDPNDHHLILDPEIWSRRIGVGGGYCDKRRVNKPKSIVIANPRHADVAQVNGRTGWIDKFEVY
jgi:hypothetical protein